MTGTTCRYYRGTAERPSGPHLEPVRSPYVTSTPDDRSTTEGPEILRRTDISARGRHRRVIMTTCHAHGATGFTNLLVTKEKGVIVLNLHVANCCVLQLDEQAATACTRSSGIGCASHDPDGQGQGCDCSGRQGAWCAAVPGADRGEQPDAQRQHRSGDDPKQVGPDAT
jgi:hypothetical protein